MTRPENYRRRVIDEIGQSIHEAPTLRDGHLMFDAGDFDVVMDILERAFAEALGEPRGPATKGQLMERATDG